MNVLKIIGFGVFFLAFASAAQADKKDDVARLMKELKSKDVMSVEIIRLAKHKHDKEEDVKMDEGKKAGDILLSLNGLAVNAQGVSRCHHSLARERNDSPDVIVRLPVLLADEYQDQVDAGTISIVGREHDHAALALWNLRPT